MDCILSNDVVKINALWIDAPLLSWQNYFVERERGFPQMSVGSSVGAMNCAYTLAHRL